MAKKRKKGGFGSNTVNIDLNIEILDEFLLYIFINPEDNNLVTRKSLSNMYDLLNIIDKRAYETDSNYLARIYFIQNILKLELKENIFNFDLLISKSLEGNYKDEIQEYIIPFLDEQEGTLSNDDLKYINKFVSDRLKYAFLFQAKEPIDRLFEDLVLNRFESMNEINESLEEELSKLSNNLRKAKLDDEENSSIDFNEIDFDSKLIDIVTELKKPTNYLKTGIIKFNQMLGGGFESGRVYLFMGITGGFKSGILLNILYWLKKYNTKYKTKDPEKQPVILYISQENSVKETMERLWKIGCSKKDIRTFSNNEIIRKFKEESFAITEESNIELSIIYRPNKSISTDDLYNIYDDYADRGKEIICIIHDYTKRIRPSNPTNELRIDLGNVVDEETVFAKTKNIPFITAAQLNRKAMEIIEEASQQGKNNAIDKLGASNVGESWAMIENADWVGLINKEIVTDMVDNTLTKEYLSFKEIKVRGKKRTSFRSFVQPFEEDNGMKLIDDVEIGKPLSILSLETIPESSLNDVKSFNEGNKKKSTPSRRKKKTIDTIESEDIINDLNDL